MELQSLLNKVNTLPRDTDFELSDKLVGGIFYALDSNDWIQWDEQTHAPFALCQFYSNTDSADKYGNIYSVLYFNDQPAFLINQYGRYLQDYMSYPVDAAIVALVQQHFAESFIRIQKESGLYIEPMSAAEVVADCDILKNLDLDLLPIDIHDFYGPRDTLLALAGQMATAQEQAAQDTVNAWVKQHPTQ